MIMLDTTVVNVSLPWMAFDLALTTSDTQWVVAAYSLGFAALLIVFGRLADRVGRRRVFVAGAAGFVLASALIGFAVSTAQVVAGRALQGFAAAAMMPAALSIINATFVGRNRGIAFAVWGGATGGMAAVGPLVGGWLTTDHSWHWAFFLNLPIALVTIAGVLRKLPESRDPEARGGGDWPGNLLSIAGVGLLAFALIEGERYGWVLARTEFTVGGLVWPRGWVALSFIAFWLGLLALIAFVRMEQARANAGKVVLLDLSLFAIRSFRNGTVVALIVSFGEFGLLYVLPLHVQGVLGYSPLETGTMLLALAVGSFVSSGLGARGSHKHGAVRLLQVGMLLEALAIGWIGLVVTATTEISGFVLPVFVYGLGIGFATAQLTGVILRDVPAEVSGQASAVQSTARQIGAAIGTAILGSILAGTTSHSLVGRLQEIGVKPDLVTVYSDFVTDTAGQLIQFLILQPQGELLVAAARDAFTSGTRWVALAATVLVGVGFAASLRLRVNQPESSEAEQHF